MSLKVIGAGLGRTGTMSLKVALEQLGYGPCYHMVEAFANMPESLKLWEAAARGEPDWAAIFAGYASTVDYPGCTFWRELLAEYPDAKVILTTRNPESWFDSVSKTIFGAYSRGSIANSPAAAFFEGTVFADFDQARMDDLAYMTGFFERWNAAVITEVPPERLLVFEAKEGWPPLCEFLGVPVPDMPYPRVNSREDWGNRSSISPQRVAAPPTLEQMRDVARGRIAALREPSA
jgi:hypothetical protein